MDADVFAYNDRVVADLHRLYRTEADAFTSLLSGTGSLGMEAGFANLLEPGDRALIVSNGVFGERMVEMATRLGAEAIPVRFPASAPVDVDVVRHAALRTRPKLIAAVHGETSTGVLNPIRGIGSVAAEIGALYTVDAVTTVGMLPFEMAVWGVDYAYTGSQKCLSAPPGLAPVAFSRRAMDAIRGRRTPVSTWYNDALGMENYWAVGEKGRKYHHTVPVQLHWATGEAIRAALDEGLENRTRRVQGVGAAALTALETVGFSAFIPEAYRLPTVLAVRLPKGLDDANVRRQLREEHFISVTGGLGDTVGKIWRLGLMGENARLEHYRRLMTALGEILAKPHLKTVFNEVLAPA
ncbi:MAG TPA: aminotransferase class V-fold PLP-dependent enzyme [Chloroflexota bacterium]|nr:aminotransferase class V-fold PLP-dependent enzyme [Chloroflexota bacterium]